jgi:hypothetical protein
MNVFTFGSNRAGRHGKGAALCALQEHGAVYGQGEGLQGQSYAIPTKDAKLKPLPLTEIKKHVDTFLAFARAHTEHMFQITRVGCGLAGYSDRQIAPMFKPLPRNCVVDKRWAFHVYQIYSETIPTEDEGLTCPDCDGRGYLVVDVSTSNEMVQDTCDCSFCGGTGRCRP